jgi:hypothetical protein
MYVCMYIYVCVCMLICMWVACVAYLGMYIANVGYAVAQLVEALRYKPQGRGLDSQWCHWHFSLT